MGTINWSNGPSNKNRGAGSTSSLSGVVNSSGSHASTDANATTIVQAGSGTYMRVNASEACRIRADGTDPTATTGHYVPANETFEFEVSEGANVRVIDVA